MGGAVDVRAIGSLDGFPEIGKSSSMFSFVADKQLVPGPRTISCWEGPFVDINGKMNKVLACDAASPGNAVDVPEAKMASAARHRRN